MSKSEKIEKPERTQKQKDGKTMATMLFVIGAAAGFMTQD